MGLRWACGGAERGRATAGALATLLCVLLVGCGAPIVTVTASPSGPPSPAATASVVIECLDATYPPPLRSPAPGASSGAFCDRAYTAVVAALGGQGGVPTTVVFDVGQYCLTSDPLALPTACPGGGVLPSDVEQPAGHALVSFAGTPEQAYLNLWWSGPTLTADLMAIAAPPPSALASGTVPALTVHDPTVHVSPSTGLHDGQTVTVAVTGFGVGAKVWLSECASASDVSGEGCGAQLAAQTLLAPGTTGPVRPPSSSTATRPRKRSRPRRPPPARMAASSSPRRASGTGTPGQLSASSPEHRLSVRLTSVGQHPAPAALGGWRAPGDPGVAGAAPD